MATTADVPSAPPTKPGFWLSGGIGGVPMFYNGVTSVKLDVDEGDVTSWGGVRIGDE